MTETKHTKHSNTSHSHFLSFYAHPHHLHYTSGHHTVLTLLRHHINISASHYTSSSQHTPNLHTSPSPFTRHPHLHPHQSWSSHHMTVIMTNDTILCPARQLHIASERTAYTPTLLPSSLPKLSKLVKTHRTLICVHNLQGTVHNNCLQLQPTNNVRPSLQQSNTLPLIISIDKNKAIQGKWIWLNICI